MNLYHRWANLDEIFAALNEPLPQCAIPQEAIKILRAERFLDQISQSVFDSFQHPNHPIQVDEVKRDNWKYSLQKNLNAWHHLLDELLLTCVSAVDPTWKSFCEVPMNPLLIEDVMPKYLHIEPFFRGIHQMVEIVLNVMIDSYETLVNHFHKIKIQQRVTGIFSIEPTENSHVIVLRKSMDLLARFWDQCATHIMLLNKMDTGSYAVYRQAILGTSGGDSKQLRLLKGLTNSLHKRLPKELCSEENIEHALQEHTEDPLLNQVLSAIRELQAAASDFWLRHLTLVVNTIGLVRGSQGLPVEKLLSFATSSFSQPDSLIQAVGKIGHHYTQFPQAVVVKTENGNKIIGDAIFAHVKNEFTTWDRYQTPITTTPAILDEFELRPLEPNDTIYSPYLGWFDKNALQPLRFAMHSYGTPLTLFNDSITQTKLRIQENQNDYWEIYFSERMNAFKKILFDVLTISEQAKFTVSVDANVTALLERLLSAISWDKSRAILTTHQEFLTVKRALASLPNIGTLQSEILTLDPTILNMAELFHDAAQRLGNTLGLVIFSQVMSNSQLSLSENELLAIIAVIPQHIPIIIDATQGLFNVPIHWGNVLKNHVNVYVLGSGIKHARATSGLGFLIHPSENSLLQHPTKTGWCAYVSGLVLGQTTDPHGKLLYDERWQWLGGTPGNPFALELFINTWDALLRAGETIKSLHRYVHSLQQYFFEILMTAKIFDASCIIDYSRRKQFPDFASNTMTLILPNQANALMQYAATQKIYFDVRHDNLLRLGFGIQHGKNDVDKLVEVCNQFKNIFSQNCKVT